MKDEDKKQITDIVNAFRLINKDIRESFEIMCNALQSNNNFTKWKKYTKGSQGCRNDYYDSLDFFDNGNWYYLNYYGMFNEKLIGFTFVVSINFDEETDKNYKDFIQNLDKDINLNTPMLCISGIYIPINANKIIFDDKDGFNYVDEILQFIPDWKNYDKNDIKYNEWFDVEMDYLKEGKVIEGFEGWYKTAKVKINHITEISSKEKAERYISDLIELAKIT